MSTCTQNTFAKPTTVYSKTPRGFNVIQVLKKQCANVKHQRPDDGTTLLHSAATIQNHEAVQFLLDEGCNAHKSKDFGSECDVPVFTYLKHRPPSMVSEKFNTSHDDEFYVTQKTLIKKTTLTKIMPPKYNPESMCNTNPLHYALYSHKECEILEIVNLLIQSDLYGYMM